MSDCGPPDFEEVLARCRKERAAVFLELGLPETRRCSAIFEHMCRTVAYAYENNPRKELVLRHLVRERAADPEAWVHLDLDPTEPWPFDDDPDDEPESAP